MAAIFKKCRKYLFLFTMSSESELLIRSRNLIADTDKVATARSLTSVYRNSVFDLNTRVDYYGMNLFERVVSHGKTYSDFRSDFKSI